ncbi:hypothetical protein MMC22_004920 [Lobaria immixta]|nr:hypothetical protein [Lobaria immixta]
MAASPSSPPGPYVGRNSVILKVSPDRFPRTLQDIKLDYRERKNQKRLKKSRNAVHDFIPNNAVRIRNSISFSNIFAHIGARIQIDPDLAEPGPNSRHVYVVSSPHWAFPASYKHWSLYSQGHFYHLTIDDAASCLVESATSTSENIGRRSKTILNHQDLSSENTSDFMKYDDNRMKVALIAYQVGKTDYTYDEIYKLAGWVIKHMPIYSRFSDNCQKFVYSFLCRIVMTKRDFATFVGNGLQLVKWDTARSTSTGQSGNGHQSCIQNGFEISNGVAKVSRLLSYDPIAGLVNDLFGPDMCRSLQISHVWHRSAAEFAENGQILKRMVQGFCEDIRNRKWEDALRSRRETAKEMYGRVVEHKRQGAKFTALEVWWYERVLRVAPEPSVAQEASQAAERDGTV